MSTSEFPLINKLFAFPSRISHGMNLLHRTTSHFTYILGVKIYSGNSQSHLLVGRKPFLIAGFTLFFSFFGMMIPITNDNECYQTYQTFKPGKTKTNKNNRKSLGLLRFFMFFSQGPWGGDMGLITN